MTSDTTTGRNLAGDLGLPTALPEEVGISAERLGRIRPAMQKYIDADLIPGVATLVARHGIVVHLDVQGLRDVERGSPMKRGTSCCPTP